MKKKRGENVLTWPQNAGTPFRRGHFSKGDVPAPAYRGMPAAVIYPPQSLASCISVIITFKVALNSYSSFQEVHLDGSF